MVVTDGKRARKRTKIRERERGLLVVCIGFRGIDIISLAAALGPLACLAAALGSYSG